MGDGLAEEEEAHSTEKGIRVTVTLDEGGSIVLSTAVHTFTIRTLISKNIYELENEAEVQTEAAFRIYTFFINIRFNQSLFLHLSSFPRVVSLQMQVLTG